MSYGLVTLSTTRISTERRMYTCSFREGKGGIPPNMIFRALRLVTDLLLFQQLRDLLREECIAFQQT